MENTTTIDLHGDTGWFTGKYDIKWMRTGGTSILGNLQLTIIYYNYEDNYNYNNCNYQ